MIYGLNFNMTRIPLIGVDGLVLVDAPVTRRYRQLFADRLKRVKGTGALRAVSSEVSCDYVLQGVCQTQDELKAMLAQANNGHRTFHVVQRKGWIGVYCG